MLQITPHHRLLLAVRPADFRRGLDGLIALCKQNLEEDPFSGTIFVFTNKKRSSIKILVFDGNGFWLCQKRFSSGRLAWWPTQNTSSFPVNPSQLLILFSQGNPLDANLPSDWKAVSPSPPMPQLHKLIKEEGGAP